MLTIEIALCLAVTGNVIWAVINWSVYRKQVRWVIETTREAEALKVHAEFLVTKAKNLVATAQSDLEYRVCSHCTKIVSKHVTDEQGITTCVNCATNTQRVQ